jgi:hypothetical protein
MERSHITSYVQGDLKKVLEEIAHEQHISLSKVIESLLEQQTGRHNNGNNGNHE